MKNETNIAKKQTGALAANIFEADANVGSQNMEQEDLALPFIKVLGSLIYPQSMIMNSWESSSKAKMVMIISESFGPSFKPPSLNIDLALSRWVSSYC